jgi:hypothetical protein
MTNIFYFEGAAFNGAGGEMTKRDIVQVFEEAVARSTGKTPDTRIFS